VAKPRPLSGRRRGVHLALPDRGQRGARQETPEALADDRLAETPERIPAPAESTPHDAAESGELEAFLAEQIRALEPEYRAPLVLRDVIGLTNQEVADVLELSLAAAKSRIHRARMQIRQELARWERTSE
jgi:RNA polymerase sigma factor (sigma-70 family)